MTSSTTARLTPHQESILDTIARVTCRMGSADSRLIGAAGACNRLRMKGMIEVAFTVSGPRGGSRPLYRPTEAGWAQVEKMAARDLARQTRKVAAQ